jgi:hypothetical protein
VPQTGPPSPEQPKEQSCAQPAFQHYNQDDNQYWPQQVARVVQLAT